MTMGGAPVKERRPKVAANLAPPSYYSTSAIVNRLATGSDNPKSVPKEFGPFFCDFRPESLHDAYDFDPRITNQVVVRPLLTRGTFGILQR